MTRNLGGIDKWLRIAVGLALLALGLLGPLGWWGLVGLVPLATGPRGELPGLWPAGAAHLSARPT